MSLLIDPPFALGQTLGVSSLTDGTGWVGVVKQFPDVNPITGAIRSNRIKTCVAVRNVATIALAPKRVVAFATAAGLGGLSTVIGYAAVLNAEHVGVVDEFLPTAGRRKVRADGTAGVEGRRKVLAAFLCSPAWPAA